MVQDFEQGGNPKLADILPEKLKKLLAGENIFQKPLKEYQEQLNQYGKMIEKSAADVESGSGEMTGEERKPPEVKTAPRNEPTRFKLTSLWKCADVKSPGNILVLSEKNAPARLAVVENWKSVAEVGLDGKLIALHKLELAESEVLGSLRSAVGADGKRWLVAFLSTQQRCHVFDEKWNVVANYPEDALKKTHSGIGDVQLGDLDGDGKLKMFVSYWGVVGVQAASLDGKRLWDNRSLSNVMSIAIGGPDEKGRRKLYCANIMGSLVVLDGQGQRQGEVKIPDRMLHRIVAADLRGDGQPLWCGMAAPALGDNLAVGLSLEGKELWNYPLPAGVWPQPIEPIIPGKLTRSGSGPVDSARARRFDPRRCGRRQTVGQVQLGPGVARSGDGRDRRPTGAGGFVGQRTRGLESGTDGGELAPVRGSLSATAKRASIANAARSQTPLHCNGGGSVRSPALCHPSSPPGVSQQAAGSDAEEDEGGRLGDGRKLLQAVVVGIGDPQVPRRVERQTLRTGDLSGSGSVGAELSEVRAGAAELLDAVVGFVGNPEIPCPVERDAFCAKELAVPTAWTTELLTHRRAVVGELNDATVVSIRNPNIPGCVDCQTTRAVKLAAAP